MPEEQYKRLEDFDRLMGGLDGLPDVVCTVPYTVQVNRSIIGVVGTYTVQTFRQRDGQGKDARTKDTCFVQRASSEGLTRMVLPPEVVAAIHRQGDSLGTKTRKKVAKRLAQERKDAGIEPAFLKKRKEGSR